VNETAQPTPQEPGAAVPLVKRHDFQLGGATIRPSLRTVEGPAGAVKGEPRVIQVLIALAEARGAVLSRDDLLQQCWEGRIVGDDAINRAVAEVRRIAAEVGAEFQVDTVPRVGYRLVGVEWGVQPESHEGANPRQGIGRRKLIAGGIATAAVLSGGGAAVVFTQRNSQIDRLIERGRVLQGSGLPGDQKRAQTVFRQAISRNPRRADGWGWLALVLDDQPAAREAAMHALTIDPREPNARAVLAVQRLDLETWTQWEDALLGILADAPDNALALQYLTIFYQGMGRCRDSWSTNERVIQVEPFNPTHQHRRALKHWIFGRMAEADKVADQALRLWPRHSTVWNSRMLIYAFSNREEAALALLEDGSSRPERLTPPSVASWRAALNAIASRTRPDITRALNVCTDAARLAPGLAANAIMVFSYLGELDSAYRIANGLFESRGTTIQSHRSGGIKDIYSDTLWGRTQFLFIPATSPFREDGRFPELCRRLGHLAYWRNRRIWPDPFVRGALDVAKLT
jgi:DNA-binding winged helix-turn-helix (wHTH) protein/tetratricopeptide (TPR) repeat protein